MNTKEKIIRTSIALFNLHGERAITTNHIASSLGISPGNLYYHFKNKEDIIRQIFALYSEHLNTHFKPLEQHNEPLEQLTQYLDSLFDLMWRYHFFYDNLTDILARDDELKKNYIAFQSRLLEQVKAVVIGLRDTGVITIDDDDAKELAHMLKMTVSFWTPYVKARRMTGVLEQQDIYNGIVKVLMIFKPYATPMSAPKMAQLQQHYQALAEASLPSIA
ncbi:MULTISPECIES: TetR/AcrR family transcriptional regulator [Pseudoalteromonas]|uniref:TetR/AcrR family transcriptional regulator n=1 Tax=Pseudoalteromonas TaxID=53246 RepID=UPI000FFF3DCE|nr:MULTISPECIES: TetR/AcrR family transcriptional regulator [Pseudoalteromonas]MCG9757972.1 TetR/AcrR family transcriptional regulator [Pseudoalteromonas sp. Isolate6]NKC19951.1 TetR family transcriptional regulator [Pseudoalteromonas galatheae]RXE85693.1 TetR family transcriptional regulator [Pseudoalteromonas sp. A757]